LAYLFPRNEKKWCFGANGWYGNSKYLFREVNEQHPEITAIWIAHDCKSLAECRRLGYKAYYWSSLKGLYHCATAKVYISNITIREINIILAGGTFYFDLWHGIPLKACLWLDKDHDYNGYRITERNRHSIVSKVVAFVELYRKPDLVLSPSRYESIYAFAPMFDVPIDKCIETNYPQNKVLHYPKERMLAYTEKYEGQFTIDLLNKISQYRKVYMYMPTWRDSGDDIFAKSRFDFEQMNQVLACSNQFLILKLHPYTKTDLSFVGSYSNMMVIDNSIDVYMIFQSINCLITDYSSVYYDFLQLKKEIVIFDFDKEEYLRKNRNFIYDFDEMMPATRAHTFSALLNIVKQETECYVEGWNEIMAKVWDAYDNDTDLVEVVKQRLKK